MSFPQTPAPAVPGAFLNTPAVASRFSAETERDPVRRLLFNSNIGLSFSGDQSSTQSRSQPGNQPGSQPRSQPSIFGQDPAVSGVATPRASTSVNDDDAMMRASQSPPAVSQPPLAKAASFINNALTKDEHYPELDTYCRRESSNVTPPHPRSMAIFMALWLTSSQKYRPTTI